MTAATFAPNIQSIVPRIMVANTAVATVQAPARAITLAELLDEYMRHYSGRDPAMGWRLQTWRRLLGERPVVAITSSEIREQLKCLKAEPARAWRGRDVDGRPIHRVKAEHKSASTINRYHALLSAVFQWAIDHELVPAEWRNPARGIKRGKEHPGVVRFLEVDERRRLLDACKASGWSKLYGLVLLALTSGARRGELLALRWRDVDLVACVAYLRTSKNGEPRTLVLVPAVVEQLQAFKHGKPEHLVFCSRRDPLRAYAMEQAWRAALRASKVERFRFHDLRHSFASMLAQEGASLVELADAMGHRTMAMVRRYAHLSTASRARLVNRVLGDVR